MALQSLMVLLGLVAISYGVENLNLVFRWKLVDFDFPSPKARQDAMKSGAFKPLNNLPLGLEVYGDRLFITVPRWKSGVPASLTYINLKDRFDSPILRPYPNWEAHKLPTSKDGESPEIVSPFRVKADRCGRLWVLDTRVEGVVEQHKIHSATQVLIYDLRTDKLIRRYQIPDDQVSKETFLANFVVEDEDCADTWGYLGDLGDPGVVVYSYKSNSSWRIKHHYFHWNPLAADFDVAGSTFHWLDGIFGMGLTAPGPDGISTLYFHPMTGTHEFAVSTRHLRNASLADTNFHKFRVVGNRGPNGQSSVAFLDKKTGVYFYALVTKNAIACWKTSSPTYNLQDQGRIFENDETMIWPNDIKVDQNNNIWVISDRLPIFLYQTLNVSDYNFRIFTAPVSEAVKGTVCDINPDATALANTSPQSGAISTEDRNAVFNKFNRPGNSPSMQPQAADKIRPPVQAFAVAEIPEMPNKFKQPQRPHFHGNPDLAFMFNPLPLSRPTNVFNSFNPPIQVPAEITKVDGVDGDGNAKKGVEFLINIPVNLYLSVETP